MRSVVSPGLEGPRHRLLSSVIALLYPPLSHPSVPRAPCCSAGDCRTGMDRTPLNRWMHRASGKCRTEGQAVRTFQFLARRESQS